jgi:Rps23 Pro-64 3,4-dihydroxylase Tpa1-like proline 4-hydroxylase
MVNFNLEKDINVYKFNWNNKKLLIFNNILQKPGIDSVYDFYNNQDFDFWNVAIYPDEDTYQNSHFFGGNQNIYPMYLTKQNDQSIERRVKFVRTFNDRGEFSYFYKRTNYIHPILMEFLSEDFLNLISEITGYRDLWIDNNFLFISSYESNHYNGTHIDGINGRIAFVFHLTKDWLPSDGGLFIKLDEKETKKVVDVVVPSFNKLVMFDVKDSNVGSPHLVSEVSSGCTKRRISFTGWIQ